MHRLALVDHHETGWTRTCACGFSTRRVSQHEARQLFHEHVEDAEDPAAWSFLRRRNAQLVMQRERRVA